MRQGYTSPHGGGKFTPVNRVARVHRLDIAVFRSTLGDMTDVSATQYFRRLARRQYLTEHEQQRRARAKAEGARRIDVTLNAKALDDYATVRRYLEGLNRLMRERRIEPARLSDSEIIAHALNRTASCIREEDTQAAKAGLRRPLVE
jgi:hypothetical protein